MSDSLKKRNELYKDWFSGKTEIIIQGSAEQLDVNSIYNTPESYKEYAIKKGWKGNSTAPIEENSSKVVPSSQAVFETPQIKAVQKQMNRLKDKSMFEQFLYMYNSPLGETDIKYRLGKVKYVRGARVPSIWTDSEGRVYTRSLFNFKYKEKLKVHDKTSRQMTFANLYFPPFTYQGRLEVAAKGWENPATAGFYQNEFFNAKTFRLSRDKMTYRSMGFKTLNDNIEMIQFIFEKITGICSTYITEWDLSLYIQEALIDIVGVTETQPTIHLNYRIKQDNPMGYTDDRAYSFGAVNGALSRFTERKPWHVTSYPLSAFWEQRSDSLSLDSNCQSNIPGSDGYPETSNFHLFHQIKNWDKWNAICSDWKDWNMYLYKALYPVPGDGLSDADLMHYQEMIENGDSKAGTTSANSLYNKRTNSDDMADDANSRLSSVGNGSNSASKAKEYAGAQDWLDQDNKGKTNAIALGVPAKHPTYYGGPHGVGLSAKSLLACFDPDSVKLRNVPRIYLEQLNGEPEFLGGSDKSVNIFYPNRTPQRALRWAKEGMSTYRNFTAYRRDDNYETILQHDFLYSAYGWWSWWWGNFWENTKNNAKNLWERLGWVSQSSNWRNISWDSWWSWWDWDWSQFKGFTFSQKIWDPSQLKYIEVPVDPIECWTSLKWVPNAGLRWVSYERVITSRFISRTFKEYLCGSEPDVNWEIVPFEAYEGDPKQSVMESHHLKWLKVALKFFGITSKLKPEKAKYRLRYRLQTSGPLKTYTALISWSGNFVYGAANWVQEDKLKELVKNNARGNQNGRCTLFLFGPDSNGSSEFILDIPCKIISWTRTVTDYHSHRSHRKHSHTVQKSWEIIECFPEEITLTHLVDLDKPVKEALNQDALDTEDLDNLSGPCTHISIYDYFKAGKLSGRGVYSSVPGFNPPVDKENQNWELLVLDKDTPMGSVFIPKIVRTALNATKAVNADGFIWYYDSRTVENYKIDGRINQNHQNAILTSWLSASFHRQGDPDHVLYNVSTIYSTRLWYLRAFNLESFLHTAYTMSSVIDVDTVRKIIEDGISPRTTEKVEGPKRNTSSIEYNYFYDLAYHYFMAPDAKSKVASARQSLKESAEKLKHLVEKLKEFRIDITKQSYNGLLLDLAFAKEVQDYALQPNDGIKLYWYYLQILYEYRKYFIQKRFNKAGGTGFALKQLEVLSIAAAEASSVEDPEDIDFSTKGPSYDVAFYEMNNTTLDKLKALYNPKATLEVDKIVKLYIPVVYPGFTTQQQADTWALKHPTKEIIKTNIPKNLAELYPEKQWALKPKDGLYQLRSYEYDLNEENKLKNNTLKTKPGFKESQLKPIYKYDICKKTIYWGDEVGKTPITRGVMVGVDAEKQAQLYNDGTEDIPAYEQLCKIQKTQDFWSIDITSVSPSVFGYQKQPRLDSVLEVGEEAAKDQEMIEMFYEGRLYPITEDQGVIAANLEENTELFDGVSKLFKN